MNTTTIKGPFLKVAEFVSMTGLEKKQVTRMIHAGDIRARKLTPGKRNSPWLIPSSEASRLLEEVA